MNFSYFRQVRVNANLEVEDIGNVAIRGNSDKGDTYLLIIETSMGITRIFQYGPAVPDIELLPKTVNCSFKRISFSQSKLQKTINDFLNNPYYNITQAAVIEKEEALKDCRSLIEYMKQDILF